MLAVRGLAMANRVRRVEYFEAFVDDKPGEAYRLLRQIATAKVNLLAFTVIPLGAEKTQIVLFPETEAGLARAAEGLGLALKGPHRAFLIQGDDELGALVELHRNLSDGHVNVTSSSGVTDGRGGYGYILHVRAQDYEQAARLIGV